MNRTKPWAIKWDGWTGPDRSIIPNRPLDKVNLTGQLGTRKVTGFNPTMTGRADTSGDVSGRYANEGVKARRIRRRCHWLMLCYWRKEIAKEEIEWHAWDPRLRVTHSGRERVTKHGCGWRHVLARQRMLAACVFSSQCVAVLSDAWRRCLMPAGTWYTFSTMVTRVVLWEVQKFSTVSHFIRNGILDLFVY